MEQLKQLFAAWAGEPCTECLALGGGGSSRRYYRLSGASHRCIGTVADDRRENEAFFAYTDHLHAKGMPVPQLYCVADDRCHYLQQDLGDQSLYGFLYEKKRQGRGVDAEVLGLYRQALADLAALQVAGADIDFERYAYPRAAFDRRSILWDLNYFKYYFLKLTHTLFDEELLENDFERLVDHLLAADCNYFLYRDFQGRNIMIVSRDQCPVTSDAMQSRGKLATDHWPLTTLYYIDYQGGRRGAAQYDVASLLYSAKSDLPDAVRVDLLNHYLDVRGIKGEPRRQWLGHFWLYLLVRILQTLGAYGFRGLYEKKDYFLQSIPLALRNLRHLVEEHPLPADLPELRRVLDRMAELQFAAISPQSTVPADYLTVTVLSFSFKKGLPEDPNGNGGGHIFDCRALPNPGRYAEYKAYTGKDRPVIEFLQREPAVDLFLSHVQSIVAQSVEKYQERHFAHLQVAFGCTGGQHRSVYCAEQTAAWLKKTYPSVHVVVRHREH